MKVLVTGANGYIGQHLVKLLQNNKHEIVVFVRDPSLYSMQDDIEAYRYELGANINQHAFNGVDVVIHLATITTNRNSRINDFELFAVEKLLESTSHNNIEKFIFISSQSANIDSPSYYGQSKWIIEQKVLKHGGIIVRPGLVYGGMIDRGLYGTLVNAAKKTPFVPSIFPSPIVNPVHVVDFCFALMKIAETTIKSTKYYVASENGIPFSVFMKHVAWHHFDRRIVSFPIPAILLKLVSKILKAMHFLKIINPDRINGLLSLPSIDSKQSLQSINLKLMSLSRGLSKNLNEIRQILIEGKALLFYASGVEPDVASLRKYTRLIIQLRRSKHMRLKYIFLKYPRLIRCIDPKAPIIPIIENERKELGWRIDAAMVIMEASSKTQLQFVLLKDKRLLSFIYFIRSLIVEILLTVLMLLFKAVYRSDILHRNHKITYDY